MKQHLKDFFERYVFSREAAGALLSAYDVLSQNAEFTALYDTFYTDDALTAESVEEKLVDIAKAAGCMNTPQNFSFICVLPRCLYQGTEKRE